ncbi:hypothetical protein DAPPUDRAFT_118642 [Daphnia pulex]|uniref:OTU domain-containing protein n=1 Tax=Daphnia pulex TaxID=6669 RepID=E9HW93_DAPPU|nr:hypothetical protein DAPPUDRAFT_118642 [Daphnia pulex]|eukprot:EFX63988.1 hypothetical protein DAPPUDRAFT_118642 [Daphnia pulex]
MVKIEPYIVINRRVCSKCARNVAMLASLDPNICHDCHNSTVKIYRDITDDNFENYPLKEANSGQCAKTLLFLCARESGNNWKIKEDYFEKLFKAFNRSGWKNGRYGGRNRPGYPRGLELVGKFASVGSATSPLSAMHTPTCNQEADVYTLNMLQDAIINAYWPGHIIQKAISHPANLCVCHQDLFVSYETNVLAADLRNAILGDLQFLAISMLATLQLNKAERGRYVYQENDTITGSQSLIQVEVPADGYNIFIKFTELRKPGTYGDHPSIAAFSSKFKVAVKIYRPNGSHTLVECSGNVHKDVMIAYNEVNHYCSLVVDIDDERQENFSTLMQPSSQGLTLPVRPLVHSASEQCQIASFSIQLPSLNNDLMAGTADGSHYMSALSNSFENMTDMQQLGHSSNSGLDSSFTSIPVCSSPTGNDSKESGVKSFPTSQPLPNALLFQNGMLWNGSAWVDWFDAAMNPSSSESRQTPSPSTEKSGNVSRSRCDSKSSQSSSSIDTSRNEIDQPKAGEC